MHIQIRGPTQSLNRRDCPAHRLVSRGYTELRRRHLAQPPEHRLHEQGQHPRTQRRVVRDQVTQRGRQRQHPLPHRYLRDHVVHQVRRDLCHPPSATTCARRALVTRERYELLVPAPRAHAAQKAPTGVPALEQVLERFHHEPRHRALGLGGLCDEGGEVLPHHAVQHRLRCSPWAVPPSHLRCRAGHACETEQSRGQPGETQHSEGESRYRRDTQGDAAADSLAGANVACRASQNATRIRSRALRECEGSVASRRRHLPAPAARRAHPRAGAGLLGRLEPRGGLRPRLQPRELFVHHRPRLPRRSPSCSRHCSEPHGSEKDDDCNADHPRQHHPRRSPNLHHSRNDDTDSQQHDGIHERTGLQDLHQIVHVSVHLALWRSPALVISWSITLRLLSSRARRSRARSIAASCR